MQNKFPLKAGDFLIFAAIIALACGIWVRLALMQTDQTYGEIWVDGACRQQIKLSDSGTQTLHISGRVGEVVVTVDGKRMCVSEADCPDHTCVKTGWISQVGQTAVCLPNRVMIKITGSTDDAVDAVAQ